MKKAALITILLAAASGYCLAATAEEILAPIYADLQNLSAVSAQAELAITETGGGNAKTKKSAYEISAPAENRNDPKNAASRPGTGWFPQFLFDLEDFLEGYDLTVAQKDARIKLGKEEIIAVRKGQRSAYPQIRIVIKSDEIQTIRFYSTAGKKYYELRIIKYSKGPETHIPIELIETISASMNSIVTHAKFSIKNNSSNSGDDK